MCTAVPQRGDVGIRNYRRDRVGSTSTQEGGHSRQYSGSRFRIQMRQTFCGRDRKSTRLNSSHTVISYAVFCLKKKISTGRVSVFTSSVRRRCAGQAACVLVWVGEF